MRLRCSAKSRHWLASFNIADLRSGSSAFTACLSHTLARTRHCLGVARRFADFIRGTLYSTQQRQINAVFASEFKSLERSR